MQLSNKTEAAPILVSEGTGNGALQLLADRYAKRLARIRARAFDLKRDPTPYYTQAEAAVRALYADAT